jgi:hypothetical protein
MLDNYFDSKGDTASWNLIIVHQRPFIFRHQLIPHNIGRWNKSLKKKWTALSSVLADALIAYKIDLQSIPQTQSYGWCGGCQLEFLTSINFFVDVTFGCAYLVWTTCLNYSYRKLKSEMRQP